MTELLSVAADAHNTYLFNAIIFGFTYFVVMCATRHHGGAHLNPVLTIASMLAGVCGAVQAIVFIIVQVPLLSSASWFGLLDPFLLLLRFSSLSFPGLALYPVISRS